MCGICAIVSDRGGVDRDTLGAMCDALVHRGPDAAGMHVARGVGLGMRRLSIIDVLGGGQPIYNEDRSLAVVFNGEIYNYRELRRRLIAHGHVFRTDTDTEVIVHLYEEHGEDVVDHLQGMFAFAIHEIETGRVFAARDRLGIKPLYYATIDGTLYLASEIKGLLAVPAIRPTMDPVAVDQYFSLLYVPAPRTIFNEIKKLEPAHFINKLPGREVEVHRYWSLNFSPIHDRPESECIEEFRARFQTAVRSHLIADVPLGVFLSGGIDSSAIVAAMAEEGHGTIRTFTLGFDEKFAAFDERERAKLVARRFGTVHEELVVDANLRDVIERLSTVFDEPLGDSGALPNLLICELARHHVTVALTGLGGDELSGGYERYLGVKLGEQYARVPRWLREGVIRPVVEWLPESRRGTRGIDRAKRFLRHGGLPEVERFFAFSSPMDRGRRCQLYTAELRSEVELDSALEKMQRVAASASATDLINRVLAIDTHTYMVDDLLVVADRASMAASMEARVPFLDHTLVEFVAGLPGHLKVRNLQKKYLLRRAFERDLPREVLRGPKYGFSLPIARWLREDLRTLIDEVLCEEEIKKQGLFDGAFVTGLRKEHYFRGRDNSTALWALLVFQLWLQQYSS